MKWIDANNGPLMLDLGSNGVLNRTCARTRELIRTSSSASVVLEEEDDGGEEAFRWSKLSSPWDVRWTDAFVLAVSLDDDAMIDVSFRDHMASVVLEEEDDGGEEAFRWSKLSSPWDVRWTDAFVLAVGLDDDAMIDVSFRDHMVVVAREEERSRVVGDGGNADGPNDDDTRHDDATNNATDDGTRTMEPQCTMRICFLPFFARASKL